MRAKEFLLEYNRQKTIQMMGQQVANAFMTGGDRRTYEFYDTTFKDEQGNPKLDVVTNYVMDKLETSDPTPKQIYVPWITREYAKGNIKRIEDAVVWLPNFLAVYEKAKKRSDFRPDAKDIMRLSYPQFYSLMSNYELPPEPIKDKGTAEVVLDDSLVRVIIPKNEQAACYYGQGTRWCTAATQSDNYFDSYNRRGNLYIILPKKPNYEGEKYQLHFQSEQFMDENDDPVDIIELLQTRFPNLFDFFAEREPEIKNLVVFAPDQVLTTLWRKIGELANDIIYEEYSEWEMNDDYYQNWRAEQAKERGYVDDNGEIDWDMVNNDDSLNDYSEYNDEAGRFLRQAMDVENSSADEIREYAHEYWSNGESRNDDQPNIIELENIYSWAFQRSVNFEVEQLARQIRRSIGIRRNKGELEVYLVKHDLPL
jgi:hypothetical protein